MPFQRLLERLSAALQALEQISTAEAHQPLAGPGQIAELLCFVWGRRLVRLGRNVISQAIPWQAHLIDCVHDGRCVEPPILISGVLVIDLKPQGAGYAIREV